jgi:hypothetical protein
MSATLALIVIWSIVALIGYCCYRLWYWTPMPTTQTGDVAETASDHGRQAA